MTFAKQKGPRPELKNSNFNGHEVYSLKKYTGYAHVGYNLLSSLFDRKIFLEIDGKIKAGFILPIKGDDLAEYVRCFDRHCPKDNFGDSFFPVAKAVADIAATKTTKFGNCESCNTRLLRFGGYYASGMCGVCHQGDSDLLSERGTTW